TSEVSTFTTRRSSDLWVRAKKLGSDYELGGLENEFTRQIESTETTISTSNDWEQFERNTVGKRIVRSEKAKRTVERQDDRDREVARRTDRKSTRLNSSHVSI